MRWICFGTWEGSVCTAKITVFWFRVWSCFILDQRPAVHLGHYCLLWQAAALLGLWQPKVSCCACWSLETFSLVILNVEPGTFCRQSMSSGTEPQPLSSGLSTFWTRTFFWSCDLVVGQKPSSQTACHLGSGNHTLGLQGRTGCTSGGAVCNLLDLGPWVIQDHHCT